MNRRQHTKTFDTGKLLGDLADIVCLIILGNSILAMRFCCFTNEDNIKDIGSMPISLAFSNAVHGVGRCWL
jgi:hypothetical protein